MFTKVINLILNILFLFYNEKKNKENFEFVSSKQIDDDDDDVESSHSDCLIIEPDISISTSDNVSISKKKNEK
jgi:hypothetical protein